MPMRNGDCGERRIPGIDFDSLMDLRVDYAFKLLFTKGDSRLMVSLLNSIFANKEIRRRIKSVVIKNPHLEKESDEAKHSILDIRAELEDGTAVIVEMHMYGLGELKAKMLRSWARVYGEELKAGENYAGQPPTIAIAFTDGQIEPAAKTGRGDKIHRLCKIMDCEDLVVFTEAMELHFIDMKAFAKAVNETGSLTAGDAREAMFAKWLSVITQKEIADKAVIESAYKDEEEIRMAISTLARQGEDKIARQAYQRRQDEIYFYNKEKFEHQQEKLEYQRKLEEKDAALAKQGAAIAEQGAALAKKDAALAEQAKKIAELLALLGKN